MLPLHCVFKVTWSVAIQLWQIHLTVSNPTHRYYQWYMLPRATNPQLFISLGPPKVKGIENSSSEWDDEKQTR